MIEMWSIATKEDKRQATQGKGSVRDDRKDGGARAGEKKGKGEDGGQG
jgi:hypothetical protein